MVAITVILAAVIGTFVLGLGDSLGDNQPTAQLSVTADEANERISIEHNGGDAIEAGDIRVRVDVQDDGFEGDNLNEAGQFETRFSVGEDERISYDVSGTDSDNDEDVDVRIRLIHQPSDSILVDRTLTLAELDTTSSSGFSIESAT